MLAKGRKKRENRDKIVEEGNESQSSSRRASADEDEPSLKDGAADTDEQKADDALNAQPHLEEEKAEEKEVV
jgi:hypothetical protein